MFSKQKYPVIYLDIIGILLSHGAVFVNPLTVQVPYSLPICPALGIHPRLPPMVFW